MKPVESTDNRTAFDWARQSGALEKVRERISTKVAAKQKRIRTRVRIGAAVVAIGFSLGWLLPYVKDTGTLATPTAHRSSFQLADGSTAELNARSELSTDFRYGRRTVHLSQGEAFFAVRSDPGHPFLVETPAGTVRVTGTEFNVRLTDEGRAEVTLLQGHVAFARPDGRASELVPGQQLESDALSARTLEPTALDAATAWRQNRFVLDGLTLGEAVHRFSAYHGQTITVDPSITSLRAAGSCALDDLPAFLSALHDTLPISIVTMGDGTRRILPRR